jgi:hypothetical protein
VRPPSEDTEITAPAASFAAAVSCTVSVGASPALGGVTLTALMGTRLTVTVDCPCTPWIVATIFAVPTPTPTTTPDVAPTLATLGSLEVHVAGRPGSGAPPAAQACAVNLLAQL